LRLAQVVQRFQIVLRIADLHRRALLPVTARCGLVSIVKVLKNLLTYLIVRIHCRADQGLLAGFAGISPVPSLRSCSLRESPTDRLASIQAQFRAEV